MVGRGTRVIVTWWDARTNPQGWMNEEDALKWAEEVPALAISEGHVLIHTDDYLLISSHALDGMCAEPTRIPVCCICQIERVSLLEASLGTTTIQAQDRGEKV